MSLRLCPELGINITAKGIDITALLRDLGSRVSDLQVLMIPWGLGEGLFAKSEVQAVPVYREGHEDGAGSLWQPVPRHCCALPGELHACVLKA